MSITAAKMVASRLTILNPTKTSLRSLIRSHLRPSSSTTHLLRPNPPTETLDNRVIEMDPARFLQLELAFKKHGDFSSDGEYPDSGSDTPEELDDGVWDDEDDGEDDDDDVEEEIDDKDN